MVVFALLYLRKAVSTWRSEALSLWMIFFSRIAFLSSGDFFFFGGRTTSGATNASMYASSQCVQAHPLRARGPRPALLCRHVLSDRGCVWEWTQSLRLSDITPPSRRLYIEASVILP